MPVEMAQNEQNPRWEPYDAEGAMLQVLEGLQETRRTLSDILS